MKKSAISEKKRDLALVRHNIIIRSNSSPKDIKSFISSCMELGGWGSKVPPNNINVVELNQGGTSEARFGKTRTKVYRAVLQEGQKTALHKRGHWALNQT